MRYFTYILVCLSISFGADLNTSLSLNDLYQVEVSSVSKRKQKIQDVATSVYVIESDEIQKSGYERLVDILKTVPGTWFSDLDYYQNTMAIREQADFLPNSVLVLIDGVPVVSPIFSGFKFSSIDIPLEQVERIEVIRGPGGSIYGANATSGIISIYTKDTEKEYGAKLNLDAGSGMYNRIQGSYGFDATENSTMYVWGNLKKSNGYDKLEKLKHDSLYVLDDNDTGTIANPFPSLQEGEAQSASMGANTKWQLSDQASLNSHLLVSYVNQKKYSMHQLPIILTHETNFEDFWDYTGIVSTRFDWNFSKNNNAFFNLFHRQTYGVSSVLDQIRIGSQITEFEMQDNFEWAPNNFLSAGANARQVRYEIYNLTGKNVQVKDPENTEYLFGSFLQSESQLFKRVLITVGAKAETWTLVGSIPQISPSARILFKATSWLNLWLAASKSVTTPGYTQTNFDVKGVYILAGGLIPGWAAVQGEPNSKPAVYKTYEGGMRIFGFDLFSMDLSSYYVQVRNKVDLSGLETTQLIRSPITGEFIFPIYYRPLDYGYYYGGEVIVTSKLSKILKLQASWSMFRSQMNSNDSGVADYYLNPHYPRTPEHVFRLSTFLNLPAGFDFNMDALIASKFSRGDQYAWSIQQYTQAMFINDAISTDWPSAPATEKRLDCALGKSLFANQMRIEIWGRNLLNQNGVVENFSGFQEAYPHASHAMYGVEAEYSF